MSRALWLCGLVLACAHTAPSADAGGGTDGGMPPSDSGVAAGLDAGIVPMTDAGTPVLGAQLNGTTLHVAIRSSAATRIQLSLFSQATATDADQTAELTRIVGSDVWTADVANVTGTVYYGFRAWGPNWPSDAGELEAVGSDGSRFNPTRLLIDPYARELNHDPSSANPMKGIVLTDAAYDTGTPPSRALTDDVIYEVHVRGLTKADPLAPMACAGTFAGAASRAMYLKSLGVTAVEFLPVQETSNDQNDVSPDDDNGDNYWGYSSLAFFAPDRRYACDQTPGGPTREFAAMVKTFHDAGLKVFIDVVYNHTAEGGGDTQLSLRGLDNAGYYELNASHTGFQDDTGVGANVNVANPMAADLIVDSLLYWHHALGVDGFRFDLAAVLGNTCLESCYHYDKTKLLTRIAQMLPDAALIAEPWGVGDGTYQIGNFPKGWSEWNGQFRDAFRTAQNKLGVTATTPATLQGFFSGSPGLFQDDGRAPAASINYLVSHDGFTLHDLYWCTDKNNGQAWPYGPSNGGDDNNLSWNQGTDPLAQAQAIRTGFALMLTSAGVPMFTGGDEFARTILCNNNSYNLDSVGTWLDWSTLEANQALVTFVTGLTQLRAAHRALRPTTFWSGLDPDGNGLKDVEWYRGTGAIADATALANPDNTYVGYRLDAAVEGNGTKSVFVAYNRGDTNVIANLPAGTWYLAADSATAMVFASGSEMALGGVTYPMAQRSVAVFIER